MMSDGNAKREIPVVRKKQGRAMKKTDFKFGTYGAIDLKPCKARTKLIKWCRGKEKKDKIKLTIEAEFDGGIQSGFDGIGQEFTIDVKNVKVEIVKCRQGK